MADDEKRLSGPGKTGEAEGESRQRRQQALRSLAQSDPGSGAAATMSAPTSPTGAVTLTPASRRRWWIAALVVTLCVVVLASVGYVVFLRPTPAKVITKQAISALATQDNLTCIQNMAISPDGASLAIQGYYHRCASEDIANYGYQPGQVNIYNVNTGQLTATLHPDDPIASALHPRMPSGVHPAQPGADVSHVIVHYLNMFWSADSTQLALTFSISTYASATPASNAPTSITTGALLTDIKVGHPRVLAHTQSPYINSSDTWNVKNSAYIPIPANVDQSRPWSPVPPALGYTWDATGALAPHGPTLTYTAPAQPAPTPGTIGSPVGSSSFTIWQPAQVSFVTDPSSSNSSARVPGLYRFSTDFPIWSPDGSWLYLDMRVNDVIVADGYSLPDAGSPLMRQIGSDTPVLPMRDKGLAAALASQSQKPFQDASGAPNSVAVAWRPDGRALAVVIPPVVVPGKVALAPAGVDIYDCATGKLLATLHQPTSPNSQSDPLFLRWTTDSSHLLLLDAPTGYFTIWGPDQLPNTR
ncbi:MAG TPA: hypothetical protein VGF38_22720 [Ktedonobacterales bacterium]